MKTNLFLATACAVSLLCAACGGDNMDFEPSESEIEAALERLASEYIDQNATLCECFTGGLGFRTAGECRRVRAITQTEASCILDEFLLDSANTGDWLVCQINTESDYSTCIASLTCDDEFGDCDQTRAAALDECPQLTSSQRTAWDECQIVPDESGATSLGDSVDEVLAAIYSAYLQEDQVLCECFGEFGFESSEACLDTRGFTNAEVDCRAAVYESYGEDGLESLECKGLADVRLVACQGNVVCEDGDARQSCLNSWGSAVAECPDLTADGEAENVGCLGIPGPE
jgi:hypothetical protein